MPLRFPILTPAEIAWTNLPSNSQMNNNHSKTWNQAMDAISLNNLHRNTQNIRNAHRLHLAQQAGQTSAPMELDPMHLGDVNNNYQVQPANKSKGGLGKSALLIGLGLVLGPAATYYAQPFVDQFWNHPNDPQPIVKPNEPAEQFTDTDTQYQLDVSIGAAPVAQPNR